MTNKTRFITRDFCLLFIANLIIIAFYYLMVTMTARYAVLAYDASSSMAGLAVAVFMVGAVAGRIISARYYRQLGMKRTAVISLVVMLASALLYLLTGIGIGLLLIVRLLHGLSFGVANTVVSGLAVSSLPRERMGEGTGYFMLSTTLGTAVGPLMALMVVGGFDFSVLFWINTGLSAIALVATLCVASGKERLREYASSGKPNTSSIIDKKTWRFSFFAFIFATAYASINAFLNNFAAELDLSAYAPFAFLLFAVLLLALRPLAGKIIDRYGENMVLIPSLLIMMVGYLFCACVQNAVMLICVGVFMAAGMGTTMSSGQAAATKRVEPSEATRAISTYYLFADAGSGVSPYFLGFIITGYGFRVMYVAAAVIAFIAVAYYYLVNVRKKQVKGQ